MFCSEFSKFLEIFEEHSLRIIFVYRTATSATKDDALSLKSIFFVRGQTIQWNKRRLVWELLDLFEILFCRELSWFLSCQFSSNDVDYKTIKSFFLLHSIIFGCFQILFPLALAHRFSFPPNVSLSVSSTPSSTSSLLPLWFCVSCLLSMFHCHEWQHTPIKGLNNCFTLSLLECLLVSKRFLF